ncbi:MAG: Rib/alpha-like domain-containing protein, partial [Clostridium perfringens]|nr:Rib/alpha-like domain-containing protein [Clostridium perfringens]
TLKTDILNKVTVPAEAGNVTKEVQGDLPTTVGSHQVPVKVTYADGTEDTVNVTVDITETQATPENSGTMTEEQGNPGEGSTTTSVIGKKDSHVTVNKANQLPNTGDVTNVGMYGGLAALSAAGLLLGLKRRRKEEESNEE